MAMSITIDNEEYLSTEEAMAFLGVSQMTFNRVRVREKLVPKKKAIGRTLYYRKADLEKLLDYRDVEPGTEE